MSDPVPPTRSTDRSTAEDSLKRKLLMGAALLLALASMYAGLLDAGRLAQVTLATGATIAVVWALTSSSRRNR